MALRIPPFLPPYVVLFLVIAYAVVALWLSLARLDAIAHLSDSTTQNAAATHDLEALLHAVNDIETGGRGFALTADDSYLEPFERGRRQVPTLLSALRDKLRGDASELALIEALVPLIAERTTISAAGIEKKRSAPDQPYEMAFGRRGKETSEGIRTIVAQLAVRKQEQFAQVQQTLIRTMNEARRDLYVMAGVTLLLVMSLFMAVRRLKAFIPVAPNARSAGKVAVGHAAAVSERDAGLRTYLRDAMLRAQVAAAAAPADSDEREQLLSLIAAMESTRKEHHRIVSERNQLPHEEGNIVELLALLGEIYSRPDRLTIKATIDRSIAVADTRKTFLVFRSAEWALEAIMLRKRAGEVTLQFTADGDNASLRIHALTDNPELPIALTPKESEEANALQQDVTALRGTFIVGDGPTGMSLTLTIPVTS